MFNLTSLSLINKFKRHPKQKTLTALEKKVSAIQNKDVETLKKEIKYYKDARQWHCDTYSRLTDTQKNASPAKGCIAQINESIEIAQKRLDELLKKAAKNI